jgi:hypothetical protein
VGRTLVKYGIDFDISADSAVAGRADVDSGAKAAAVAASAAIRHTFIMLEGILAHDGLTFWGLPAISRPQVLFPLRARLLFCSALEIASAQAGAAMGDSELSASQLRQRYNRGGTASDSELSAAQLRARYGMPSNKNIGKGGGDNTAMMVVAGVVVLAVVAVAGYMMFAQ